MLGTILKWVILLPIIIAIVLLAIANDQTVTVHLNPFDKADPVLKVDLALYQIGFIVFFVGVIIGGIIAWSSGARHRRRLRAHREDAAPWQTRPERSGERNARSQPSQASVFLPRPERG